MLSKTRQLAIAALISFGLITTTAACAPSNVANDGSNLSTSLAPVPLEEPATITMTVAGKYEVYTPALLAIAEGEFDKENITVKLETISQAESIPALALGTTDVAVSTFGAILLNAIAGGAELKMVLPAGANLKGDGLYVRPEIAEQGPSAFAGKTLGMAAGIAQTSMIPVLEYLAEGGVTLDDFTIETIPQADLPAALAAGKIDGFYVASPQHLALIEEGLAVRVAGFDPGVYTTGVIFGPNLLTKNPELGQAVVRAIARTTQTYLQGDYKADTVAAQKVADALEISVEDLRATESMVFGFEEKTEIVTEIQELWISVGDILTYETVLEPERYIDSSFIDRIVIE